MKTRYEILKAKAIEAKRQRNKRTALKINTGIILMAAGCTLAQIAASNPQVVQAQTVSSKLTKSDFLGLITDYAKNIAAENDLYASVMIAQAALESGWGNSTLAKAPNNNLFGIKGEYNGQSVNMETLEDDGTGNYYTVKEPFRKYDNYGQSLTDYASLLTGDNDPNSWRYSFYAGARTSNTSSYTDATAYLTGRYATDTSYGEKLNRIIKENNLTAYDTKKTAAPQTPVENAPVAGGSTYTVQAGDGFWGIARKFGVSVDALKSVNGVSSNLIYPGQVLKLPSKAVVTTPETKPVTQTPNPSTPSTPTTGQGTYTIQRGDGLYAIANKHGMTLAQLKSLNGLTGDLIHPGQVLKVSQAVSTKPSTPSAPETPTTGGNTGASAGNYTVVAGDGLYRIATKHGMTLAQLKSLNGLSGDLIHPGQVLKVSGSATSPVESKPSAPVKETNTPAPVDNNNTAGTYTVKAGDGLYRIAINHGISVSQLKSLNGLNSDMIYPGQVLAVSGTAVTNTPVTQAPAPVETPTVNAPAPTEDVTPTPIAGGYTVKAGDTLYSIAKKNGLDVNQLIASNNGSTAIFVGQTINFN